jgi:hypothetical protein
VDKCSTHTLAGFLTQINGTWPYYEMVNIAPSSGAPFVESRECFDFVIDSLRYMNLFGASFNGSLMRNEVFVYAKSATGRSQTTLIQRRKHGDHPVLRVARSEMG